MFDFQNLFSDVLRSLFIARWYLKCEFLCDDASTVMPDTTQPKIVYWNVGWFFAIFICQMQIKRPKISAPIIRSISRDLLVLVS